MGEYQIQLRSGNYFDFRDPAACEILIEDIAASLSKICRFTGHCKEFYSVAEHSILVGQVCPEEDALEGHCHDASEAYYTDIASPLKRLLPDYQRMEKFGESIIMPKLGCRFPFPSSVKIADMQLLKAEQLALFDIEDEWISLQKVSMPNVEIRCLEPKQAEILFLERYYHLKEIRDGRISSS